MPRSIGMLCLALLLACGTTMAEEERKSFGERLGWGPEDKIVIMHIDDVGMSHDTNRGTIKALEEGVANSFSIMMPTPWVSEFNHYMQKNEGLDAGLHLTMTSEWNGYRWGPVAGKAQVPGLVDVEGCMWGSVKGVVMNASADEVEIEIRAQIDKAETMGIDITHLDSHMGTLFEMKFLDRYLKVGMEKQIPVLFPGGHCHYIGQGSPIPPEIAQKIGDTLWESGLPVVDDIYAATYGWDRSEKVERYSEVIRGMKPGILYLINHATDPTEVFDKISTSGESRLGDLEALVSPELKKVIEEEGIILTTMRELMERRKKVQE